MTAAAEFQIAYDGDALRSHAMDVRNLAPALLAFGKLFDESNRVINGNGASVKLQVKATSPASFDILFLLDQSYVSQVTAFLSGEGITSAVNLLALLGFGLGVGKVVPISFFSLVRRLQGKKPTKVTDQGNGFIQIEFGSETFTVPAELLRLYQDIAVRKATMEILEPLKTDGVDTFKIIGPDRATIEVITKSEVDYYDLPEIDDEVILETEHEAAYSIISLAFKEDNKWRLYDGSSSISVKMEDSDFLYKVDNNLVSFSKGDLLICKVRAIQLRTETGLKTEYTVLKVINHKTAARQLSLL
ncbi:MAG: hypothetical protein PHX43_05865 [Alphaproteobacteria bacterium]|nr:hypothetical protein [Alphaproteobacteria bacterium]